LAAAALATLLLQNQALAEDAKDQIEKFLIDLGSGSISAAEVIGISASAITTIESPKDFIAAVNATNTGDAKAGVAFAITPARTSIAPLSIQTYSTRSNYLARIWGGTTLSYAQNINSIADVDYKQNAAAIQISYYLDPDDDPAVAAYKSFANCPKLQAEIQIETDKLQEALKTAQAENNGRLTKLERDSVINSFRLKLREDLAKANEEAKACALKGFQAARKKWNASQLSAAYGAGWIRGTASGASRLSLGRTTSIAGAFGLSESSLLNVTVRRTTRELDLSSLSATPAYKDSNLVAGRFTYGYGDERDLYVLAEISNAKASSPTLSNAAFKYALGVDKRLTDSFGLWVEFRVGRSRMIDGTSDQTAALLNIKVSPTSTLPKAAMTQ